MVGTLQPLDQKFPIVDANGVPTDYFIRWAQQKQIDIGDSITLGDLQDYLTAHKLVEGSGIQFTPDGDINHGPTIAADVQEILDQLSATRGTVLYRGLLGWAALLPGAAGLFLKTAGAGADPLWATPASGAAWDFSPPAASAFATVSGDATNVTLADDADVGLTITGGAPVIGNIMRIAKQALPSAGAATFTATAKMKMNKSNLNNGCGLFLRESATNKIVMLGSILFDTYCFRGTMTAFTAAIFNYTNYPRDIWVRIVYDHPSTTYSFYVSQDGKKWLLEGTVAAVTAFTTRANEIGFGFQNATASATKVMDLTIPYFSLT